MSNRNMMLHIPVQHHRDNFDDCFRNRWLQVRAPCLSTEMERQHQEWDAMLGDMKNEFFDFSPLDDLVSHHYESDSAIKPGPSGNPEFAVSFNVEHFKPDEIKLSTKDGQLTVAAHHEEKADTSSSLRGFERTVDIPRDVQIGLMKSTLSKDGILSIHAPINPLQISQQDAAGAIADGPSDAIVAKESAAGGTINYSLSIAGYKPQEVSVTVEGRRVTVHAKCEEESRGHSARSEMIESFDLPPTVDAHQVRSYIKDGSTLFVEAYLQDDLVGKNHVVPITNKLFDE